MGSRATLRTITVTATAVLYASALVSITAWTASRLLGAENLSDAVVTMFSYRNTPDVPWERGFGLVYAGVGGLVWALTQAAVTAGAVIGFFVGTAVRSRWLRRGAMLALLAHGLLWFGNALYFMIFADWEFFGIGLLGHTLGVAAVVAMLVRWWGGETTRAAAGAPETAAA